METTAISARLTAVPERTIRRWVISGRLTYRRRGRALLVNPLEVSELAERRDGSGSLPALPGARRRSRGQQRRGGS